MSLFRPCIDLHHGKVKQIVGGSLQDARVDHPADSPNVVENFVADQSAGWFAQKYANDQLTGGHVIQLGPNNQSAAVAALNAYPGGLQIGGGVNIDNAAFWLDQGASHVIVTSWLFDNQGRFRVDRLDALVARIGPQRIVIDLSCKRNGDGWTVAMNRWQTLTDLSIDHPTLDRLADHCDEFLIHAADVEGLCQGIDEPLVQVISDWAKRPITYAGGIATMSDIQLIEQLSGGKIDYTIGSALDLFGGHGFRYDALVSRNRTRSKPV